MRGFLSASVCTLTRLWPAIADVGSLASFSADQSLETMLDSADPAAVLVGTTALPGVERQLTTYASERGIRSVAIVDERYGWRRRFSDGQGNLCRLPDAIAVMDEECYENAIADGLPADCLHVTGSPILSYLVHHRAVLGKRPARSFDRSRKQVTFISETFAQDNGLAPDKPGRLGPFLGFTEDTVRHDLLSALEALGSPTVVVEKLHPSDGQAPKEGWMGANIYWRQVSGGDLWSLLVESDAVVGMRSMALLEAGLLGCRVASYQPNFIGEDQCVAVRFGVAQPLDRPQDLQAWLLASLSAQTRYVSAPSDLPFVRPDAVERVADLVLP